LGSFFSVKRIYVVAGEMSGDAHAAGLLRELTGLVEGLEIRGAGGPEMKALSGGGTKDWVEDAAVMGVIEVLKRYGWFRERFGEMLEEIKIQKPDVLLLVDYPGFNLRFADAVRRELPDTITSARRCGLGIRSASRRWSIFSTRCSACSLSRNRSSKTPG